MWVSFIIVVCLFFLRLGMVFVWLWVRFLIGFDGFVSECWARFVWSRLCFDSLLLLLDRFLRSPGWFEWVLCVWDEVFVLVLELFCVGSWLSLDELGDRVGRFFAGFAWVLWSGGFRFIIYWF